MTEHLERIGKLRAGLRASGQDAWLISNPTNVTYLSGFTGTDACLLVSAHHLFLITDSRYTEQASIEAPWAEVITRSKGMFDETARLARPMKVRALGFEPSIPFASYRRLKSKLSGAKLVALRGQVERLRETKSGRELALIRGAIASAEAAYRDVLGRLRRRQTEKDAADKLYCAMRRRGAEDGAFPIIVASGPRSSLPHANVSHRMLQQAEPIILDWGAVREGYRCDLTRTFFLAKIPAKAREIYAVVLEAQRRAIAAIRPGVAARSVDRAARSFITEKGYGKNFGHGLGHGVGLEVHEGPTITRNSRRLLRQGMVFTVEPAIYIPGWGGIRIEDMVSVTEDGCRVLTHLPKAMASARVTR